VADIVEDVEETKYRIPRMSSDVVYQYVTAESNSVIREVHLQVRSRAKFGMRSRENGH
jgi:hypothetical protein